MTGPIFRQQLTMGKLGLPSLAPGAKIQSQAGAAPLTGVVETVGPESRPNQVILRLDEPCQHRRAQHVQYG